MSVGGGRTCRIVLGVCCGVEVVGMTFDGCGG